MEIVDNIKLLNRYLNEKPYINYFRKYLHPYTKIIDFESGEYVLKETETFKYLYLMISGQCNIRVMMANGKSVILRTLKAPCLIGEMELIRDMTSFSVQALMECRMLAIDLNECKDKLLEDTFFLRKMCSELIYKERSEALSLVRSFAYPFEDRLAKFILDNRQGNKFLVKKVQIAESLGVSYRHVETVMSDFVKKGYLSKNKLVYTIEDKVALKQLAKQLYDEDLMIEI